MKIEEAKKAVAVLHEIEILNELLNDMDLDERTVIKGQYLTYTPKKEDMRRFLNELLTDAIKRMEKI